MLPARIELPAAGGGLLGPGALTRQPGFLGGFRRLDPLGLEARGLLLGGLIGLGGRGLQGRSLNLRRRGLGLRDRRLGRNGFGHASAERFGRRFRRDRGVRAGLRLLGGLQRGLLVAPALDLGGARLMPHHRRRLGGALDHGRAGRGLEQEIGEADQRQQRGADEGEIFHETRHLHGYHLKPPAWLRPKRTKAAPVPLQQRYRYWSDEPRLRFSADHDRDTNVYGGSKVWFPAFALRLRRAGPPPPLRQASAREPSRELPKVHWRRGQNHIISTSWVRRAWPNSRSERW